MRVIISGAAGVLGEAVRDTFVKEGAMVSCIAIGREGSDDDGAAWFACADLADELATSSAVGRALAWMGGIDALVHVAGAFEWKKVEDSSVADWRALYASNVETTLVTIKACLPSMRAGASLVAVGAASAQPAGVGMAAYGAAKSGVGRLIEALAQEIAPRGIRANAVLPSIIDTPRNRTDMPDVDPATWASPAAVADVIRFLAQPGSRAISGALIPVTHNG
ncbi:SDR family oxidoreductase [Sphingomonas sp. PAMC 26617]|uniref:SDR family oxidoreductase n=1 Tax=Sphingomonas sp. PAMC 26617 TaxID=1112216 RepID=UPI000497984D|nr:SDR family oxidoreductase [Sphingomonas sp. PAMC 26617]